MWDSSVQMKQSAVCEHKDVLLTVEHRLRRTVAWRECLKQRIKMEQIFGISRITNESVQLHKVAVIPNLIRKPRR